MSTSATRKALVDVQKGVEHLKQARSRLVLTDTEAQQLDAILERNIAATGELQIRCREETIAARHAEKELKRLADLRRGKVQADRDETHRKSGFSGYVVKVGGSFESNSR
jgi:hypothetical protein